MYIPFVFKSQKAQNSLVESYTHTYICVCVCVRAQTNIYDQERSCSRVRKPRSSAKSDRISHPSPLGARCSLRPEYTYMYIYLGARCSLRPAPNGEGGLKELFETCVYFTYYRFVFWIHDICTYVYTYM